MEFRFAEEQPQDDYAAELAGSFLSYLITCLYNDLFGTFFIAERNCKFYLWHTSLDTTSVL